MKSIGIPAAFATVAMVSCLPAGRQGIQGVDVSHNQGSLDWDVASGQGVRFAYIKATEGADWTDPASRSHQEAARAHGLVVGAYHYFTFCADPERQARHFLATVDLRPGDLLPAVDVENQGNCLRDPDSGTLRVNLGIFCATVLRATGREPVLYMTYWFYWRHFGSRSPAGPLWLRTTLWKPPDGAPWAIWQYATGSLPGAGDPVDRDVLRDGAATLASLRF